MVAGMTDLVGTPAHVEGLGDQADPFEELRRARAQHWYATSTLG